MNKDLIKEYMENIKGMVKNYNEFYTALYLYEYSTNEEVNESKIEGVYKAIRESESVLNEEVTFDVIDILSNTYEVYYKGKQVATFKNEEQCKEYIKYIRELHEFKEEDFGVKIV